MLKIIYFTLLAAFVFGCSVDSNDHIINFGKDITNKNFISNIDEVTAYSDFKRNGLDKIRPEWLISGVSAKEIELDFNLPKGEYIILNYLESGLTDSAYLDLYINGKRVEYDWQYFAPPAEGRNNIQDLYRIISAKIDNTLDDLKVRFEGSTDSVRLLAAGIYPLSQKFKDPGSEIESKLYEIGNIDSGLGSEEIMEFANTALTPGNDPFDEYLNIKLKEFSLAIDLFNMMGWEKGTEIYGLAIFARLHQCVMLFDGIIDDPWIGNYLNDRARWYRGRLLWWLNKERGGRGENEKAMIDLNHLANKYPDNKLLRMYLGEKVDIPDAFDTVEYSANVPEWSKLQHEAIGRLTSEIKWWVEERQAENGELGGKIGDDVEILRWWSALAAFGDTNTINGWKKLGEAVWNNPKVFKGYSRRPIDVEHGSEFIADAFPEMIYFDGANSDKYLKPSADYFDSLWTFKNKFGRRFFKSSWFSSTEVVTDPPKDRDLAMNNRAVKAVRYYAWKTGDTDIKDVLYEWSESWKIMAMLDQKGKPVGLFPASVRGTDEQFNGDGENWYESGMYWRYFNWEHGGGTRFYDQLLFSYITHNDEQLLQPLKETLSLVKEFGNLSGDLKEGSKAWAARIIANNPRFWNVVSLYRTMTGDKAYDRLISKFGTPYSRYLVTKNKKYLLSGLQSLLDDIRYNTPLRTTEVIHTDRVRTSDIITLKGMITGNDAYETDSPFLSVTYSNTTNDFTALVKENFRDKLVINMFSHSSTVTYPVIRVWLLENGTYELKLSYVKNNQNIQRDLEIEKRGQEIRLEIPPGKEIEFSLIKKI